MEGKQKKELIEKLRSWAVNKRENEIEICFVCVCVMSLGLCLRENENKSIKMNSDVSNSRINNVSEWFLERMVKKPTINRTWNLPSKLWVRHSISSLYGIHYHHKVLASK